ncbi:unnamed protein product [Schistocephalus solidus]|uniref:SH2 domain-containing protein n=1 Tax=Schistocephalus solidus TaxID=70667 RepID=A0A183SMV5_SCHSO|nr:unnamed protein product [Schistocephalus solidus]
MDETPLAVLSRGVRSSTVATQAKQLESDVRECWKKYAKYADAVARLRTRLSVQFDKGLSNKRKAIETSLNELETATLKLHTIHNAYTLSLAIARQYSQWLTTRVRPCLLRNLDRCLRLVDFAISYLLRLSRVEQVPSATFEQLSLPEPEPLGEISLDPPPLPPNSPDDDSFRRAFPFDEDLIVRAGDEGLQPDKIIVNQLTFNQVQHLLQTHLQEAANQKSMTGVFEEEHQQLADSLTEWVETLSQRTRIYDLPTLLKTEDSLNEYLLQLESKSQSNSLSHRDKNSSNSKKWPPLLNDSQVYIATAMKPGNLCALAISLGTCEFFHCQSACFAESHGQIVTILREAKVSAPTSLPSTAGASISNPTALPQFSSSGDLLQLHNSGLLDSRFHALRVQVEAQSPEDRSRGRAHVAGATLGWDPTERDCQLLIYLFYPSTGTTYLTWLSRHKHQDFTQQGIERLTSHVCESGEGFVKKEPVQLYSHATSRPLRTNTHWTDCGVTMDGGSGEGSSWRVVGGGLIGGGSGEVVPVVIVAVLDVGITGGRYFLTLLLPPFKDAVSSNEAPKCPASESEQSHQINGASAAVTAAAAAASGEAPEPPARRSVKALKEELYRNSGVSVSRAPSTPTTSTAADIEIRRTGKLPTANQGSSVPTSPMSLPHQPLFQSRLGRTDHLADSPSRHRPLSKLFRHSSESKTGVDRRERTVTVRTVDFDDALPLLHLSALPPACQRCRASRLLLVSSQNRGIPCSSTLPGPPNFPRSGDIIVVNMILRESCHSHAHSSCSASCALLPGGGLDTVLVTRPALDRGIVTLILTHNGGVKDRYVSHRPASAPSWRSAAAIGRRLLSFLIIDKGSAQSALRVRRNCAMGFLLRLSGETEWRRVAPVAMADRTSLARRLHLRFGACFLLISAQTSVNSIVARAQSTDGLNVSSSSSQTIHQDPLTTGAPAPDNETVDINKEPWFHGVLPRSEVDRLLQVQGDFLVRETSKATSSRKSHLNRMQRHDSESDLWSALPHFSQSTEDLSSPLSGRVVVTRMVLSVYWNGCKHFILQGGDSSNGRKGGWFLEDYAFPTIRDLVEFHMRTGKPVTAGSGALLLNPIARPDWQLDNADVQLLEKIGQVGHPTAQNGSIRFPFSPLDFSKLF